MKSATLISTILAFATPEVVAVIIIVASSL
jgi:hypothetical protein